MPKEQTLTTFKYKGKEVTLTDEQMDKGLKSVGGVVGENTEEMPGSFVHIGPKIAHQISRDIAALLRENLGDIDVAYTESEDGLSVAFTLKLSTPKTADGVKIETGINFVKERVKMGRVAVVDEKQGRLFD